MIESNVSIRYLHHQSVLWMDMSWYKYRRILRMCAPRLHFLMYAMSGHWCVRAPFSSQQHYQCGSNFKFKFHIREIKVEIRLLFKFGIRNLNLLTVILNLLCFECVYFSVVTHRVACDWMHVVCVCSPWKAPVLCAMGYSVNGPSQWRGCFGYSRQCNGYAECDWDNKSLRWNKNGQYITIHRQ